MLLVIGIYRVSHLKRANFVDLYLLVYVTYQNKRCSHLKPQSPSFIEKITRHKKNIQKILRFMPSCSLHIWYDRCLSSSIVLLQLLEGSHIGHVDFALDITPRMKSTKNMPGDLSDYGIGPHLSTHLPAKVRFSFHTSKCQCGGFQLAGRKCFGLL